MSRQFAPPGAMAGWSVAIGSVWSLCVASWAIAQSPEEQVAFIARGLALAEANCGRCHALGMTDASPHKDAPPFRVVVERYPSENLAEALAEGIVSGHPDMPVYVFQPHEIEAFLAYLDSLGGSDADPPK